MTAMAALAPEQATSRAREIIELLARRGELTVADLVAELGITATAVRQQVARLLDRGWVVRRRRARGPGRPADVFSVSDQGRRLFAHEVEEFARLFIEELAGTEGQAKLRELLQRVHARMTAGLASEVAAGDPGARLAEVAGLLKRRGTIAGAERTGRDVRLSVFTCPYHGLAAAVPRLCELERDTLSRVAGGPVELVQRLLDGHGWCEFRLAVAEGGGAEPQAGGAAPGG